MKKILLAILLIILSLVSKAVSKPNFIIIYLDDMGFSDVGLYKNEELKTPNIDKLSSEGQTWTNFYATSSVCTPSRAGLLTGRLPVRNGLYGDQIAVFFPGSNKGIPVEEVTIAEALQKDGYATGIFGKWHLGDKEEFLPTRHGFDEWFGIPYSNDMDWKVGEIDLQFLFKNPSKAQALYQEIVPAITEKIYNPMIEDWNVPLQRSKKARLNTYVDELVERPTNQNTITKRFTEETIDFIEKHGKTGKQFFAFLSHSMPHVPLFTSKEFIDKTRLGRYADVLSEIDWSVGRVLKKIKEMGIDDNTYIIFTSDNGPWLLYPGESGSAKPLRNGKGTTFEGGMRVMTIFSGPEIKSGVVEDLGSQTDFFKTIISLAKSKYSYDPEDSYDLSETLKGKISSPRDFIPYYVGSELRAFRYMDYKIHFITAGAYGLEPIRQEHETPILYNLKKDISEGSPIEDEKTVKEIANEAKEFLGRVTVQESILDLQFSEN